VFDPQKRHLFPFLLLLFCSGYTPSCRQFDGLQVFFPSYAKVVNAWIWRLCGHLFRIWPRPVMTPESSLTIAALSMLMSTMVSATFVCQVAIYTRERAGFGYQYFIRWHCTKRKYQHLPYVTNMPVPVRYPFDKH
jgi:hypothetical protein